MRYEAKQKRTSSSDTALGTHRRFASWWRVGLTLYLGTDTIS